ncbi:MAG: hypothetical protein AAFQ80_09950 [Cyanobacteria bacterium J06621_8]
MYHLSLLSRPDGLPSNGGTNGDKGTCTRMGIIYPLGLEREGWRGWGVPILNHTEQGITRNCDRFQS